LGGDVEEVQNGGVEVAALGALGGTSMLYGAPAKAAAVRRSVVVGVATSCWCGGAGGREMRVG
jgi:hypothetical protein